MVGAAGKNAVADKFDKERDRTVDQGEEHTHGDAEEEPALVGFDVRKQLEVRLPIAFGFG